MAEEKKSKTYFKWAKKYYEKRGRPGHEIKETPRERQQNRKKWLKTLSKEEREAELKKEERWQRSWNAEFYGMTPREFSKVSRYWIKSHNWSISKDGYFYDHISKLGYFRPYSSAHEFAIIPMEVFAMVGAQAAAVYGILRYKCYKGHVALITREEIAEKMCSNVKTVGRMIQKLKDVQLVKEVRCRNRRAYLFLLHPDLKMKPGMFLIPVVEESQQ